MKLSRAAKAVTVTDSAVPFSRLFSSPIPLQNMNPPRVLTIAGSDSGGLVNHIPCIQNNKIQSHHI